MSQELTLLAIAVSNDLDRVFDLQELLRITLEEIDNPTEKTLLRLDLLVSIYLREMELQLEEMSVGLREIRCQLANSNSEPPNDPRTQANE